MPTKLKTAICFVWIFISIFLASISRRYYLVTACHRLSLVSVINFLCHTGKHFKVLYFQLTVYSVLKKLLFINMAKNTSSSAFRKIDIDQYNEDNFRDDEAEQSIPTGPDEGEVCALLNQYPFQSVLMRYLMIKCIAI